MSCVTDSMFIQYEAEVIYAEDAIRCTFVLDASFISACRKCPGKIGKWVELQKWCEEFTWLAWCGGMSRNPLQPVCFWNMMLLFSTVAALVELCQ
jgi:hypothetical protein